MVKLEDRDLYQLLISELRYSIKRDNHLAPGTCVQHIKMYLPEMSREWRTVCAKQLADESIHDRIWTDKGPLEYDGEWDNLLVFLLDYLEAIPSNAGIYMQYLYHKPDHEAEVDFLSPLIHNKILQNKSYSIT